MDVLRVAHHPSREADRQAGGHGPDGIGVSQDVGTQGDSIALQGITEDLGQAGGGLGGPGEIWELVLGDPAAGAGRTDATSGLGVVGDDCQAIGADFEVGGLVGAKAEGSADTPHPAPVGELDARPDFFDLGVGGDIARGELGDAIAAASNTSLGELQSEGFADGAEEVALVPAAGAALRHEADDAQQDGLGDRARGRHLLQG